MTKSELKDIIKECYSEIMNENNDIVEESVDINSINEDSMIFIGESEMALFVVDEANNFNNFLKAYDIDVLTEGFSIKEVIHKIIEALKTLIKKIKEFLKKVGSVIKKIGSGIKAKASSMNNSKYKDFLSKIKINLNDVINKKDKVNESYLIESNVDKTGVFENAYIKKLVDRFINNCSIEHFVCIKLHGIGNDAFNKYLNLAHPSLYDEKEFDSKSFIDNFFEELGLDKKIMQSAKDRDEYIKYIRSYYDEDARKLMQNKHATLVDIYTLMQGMHSDNYNSLNIAESCMNDLVDYSEKIQKVLEKYEDDDLNDWEKSRSNPEIVIKNSRGFINAINKIVPILSSMISMLATITAKQKSMIDFIGITYFKDYLEHDVWHQKDDGTFGKNPDVRLKHNYDTDKDEVIKKY